MHKGLFIDVSFLFTSSFVSVPVKMQLPSSEKFIFIYCCLFLKDLISEQTGLSSLVRKTKVFFRYYRCTTGMPCSLIHHSSHAINRC